MPKGIRFPFYFLFLSVFLSFSVVFFSFFFFISLGEVTSPVGHMLTATSAFSAVHWQYMQGLFAFLVQPQQKQRQLFSALSADMQKRQVSSHMSSEALV